MATDPPDFPPEDHQSPADPPPLLSATDRDSLISHGFLQVSLPPNLSTLYAQLASSASSFFDQPSGAKTAQYPSAQGTELGFYSIPGEKEYLTIRREAQSQVDAAPTTVTLDSLTAATWHRTAAYLYRILVDVSRALDIPRGAWDAIAREALQMPASADEASPTLLRMFRYAPEKGVATPHTDGGLLTLCVGRSRGLQVWKRCDMGESNGHGDDNGEGGAALASPPGDWIDADGPCVIVGSTLRVLSSMRVTAGLHRVVANPEGRESLVFALRPALNCVLDLRPFGGTGEVAMRAFWDLLSDSRVNVNAVGELREKQKEKLRLRKLAVQQGQG